jgi:hypothetical protein
LKGGDRRPMAPISRGITKQERKSKPNSKTCDADALPSHTSLSASRASMKAARLKRVESRSRIHQAHRREHPFASPLPGDHVAKRLEQAARGDRMPYPLGHVLAHRVSAEETNPAGLDAFPWQARCGGEEPVRTIFAGLAGSRTVRAEDTKAPRLDHGSEFTELPSRRSTAGPIGGPRWIQRDGKDGSLSSDLRRPRVGQGDCYSVVRVGGPLGRHGAAFRWAPMTPSKERWSVRRRVSPR